MNTRTTASTITFQAPFTLNENVGQLPAGTYEIEVDEEAIALGERPAFRRVATLLIVREPGSTRTLQIDSKQLDVALERDARHAA